MDNILVIVKTREDIEALDPVMQALNAYWGNDKPFKSTAESILDNNPSGIVIRILETGLHVPWEQSNYPHKLDYFGIKDVEHHRWLRDLYDKAKSVDEFISLANVPIQNMKPCDPSLVIQL